MSRLKQSGVAELILSFTEYFSAVPHTTKNKRGLSGAVINIRQLFLPLYAGCKYVTKTVLNMSPSASVARSGRQVPSGSVLCRGEATEIT